MRDDPTLIRARTEATDAAGAKADELSTARTGAFVSPAARGRLTSALLFKGALDLLFVAALAVGAHYVAFRPHFRGVLDKAGPRAVEGWAYDRADPRRPVEVQLYLDGRFVAAGFADRPRPDVRAAGLAAHERVGFDFRLDPPVERPAEARVYAVTRSAGGARLTLRQIGGALRINPRR
jgi:hypothetical protein